MLIVNGRFLGLHVTGIERYAREMLARLPSVSTRPVAPKRSLYGLAGHAWEQIVLPRFVGRGDLLWSPANWGPVTIGNQILTLHDLAVFDHPEWFSPRIRMAHRALLPRVVKSVRRIATDSQFSKARILEHFDLDTEAISVVYPGVGFRSLGEPEHRLRPDEGAEDQIPPRRSTTQGKPYLLANAGSDPRKNLNRLLEAWELVHSTLPDLDLLVFGAQSSLFARQTSRPVPPSVQLLGYISDEQLTVLYRNAVSFIYPSLYEGFGLPPLEAMAMGIPTVASDIPVFREVLGEGARLVNPVDHFDIAKGIIEVVTDEALRHELWSRGRAVVTNYSWERAAGELMAIAVGLDPQLAI